MKNQASLRQEVNLFTLDFHREDQAFSFRLIVRATIGFFCLLMLFEGVVAWQWFESSKTIATLEAEQQIVNQRLLALKQTQPLSQRPMLEEQFADLQGKIQHRYQLQAIMGGQTFGNFEGFSPYLIGLGRHANRNVSLTHFALLEGGSQLELSGWTNQAEAVPSYLRDLRKESCFEKVRFGVLRIDNDESASNKLKFVLGNTEASNT